MTLSASKLELAMRCEGHLTLPHVDEPNQWSDAGNLAHAADEDAINSGAIPPEYEERWPGLTWRSEISYAYDVATDTARYLGIGLKRHYGSLGPFEIPGTVDALGTGDGVIVIVDKKSFEAVTPARENPQLRFLALAAIRSWGIHDSCKLYVAINHELTGMDVAEIDLDFDLDAIAQEVKQIYLNTADVKARARAGQSVTFRTGRWCRWCPAFNHCPEQSKLHDLVKQDPDQDPELALKLYLDEDSAPDVYALYRRIGILHKRIGQSIHAYVSQRPIPIAPGRMYGMRNKLGNTKLDGQKVWETVRDVTQCDELADECVTKTSTQKLLKQNLKPAALKAVMTKLKENGGAERKPTISFEEYDVGPKLVTDGEEND